MDTEFYTVVPSEGFTILNDLTFRPISKDGTRVRKSSYWDRLIEEKAVSVKDDKPVDPVTPPVTPPKNSKAIEGDK